MSLRLLYSKEGIKVPEKQDLYDIGLKGSKKYLTRARELIKIKHFSMMKVDAIVLNQVS
jgi:hypothetical protein